MTIVAFGQHNLIAVPQLNCFESLLSMNTIHTHPSFDPFYSRYGFALPCQRVGMMLDTILDKAFPFETKFTHFIPVLRYILVDHSGKLWRVLVQRDKEEKDYLFSYNDLRTELPGWWIVQEDHTKRDVDIATLVGFLRAEPKVRAINAFWKKSQQNEDLVWLKVEDIVAKLRAEYPPIKKAKPIDQLIDEKFSLT